MPDDPSRTPTPWSTAGGDNTRRGAFRGRVEIGSEPARRLPALGAVHASIVFDRTDRAFVTDMAGGVQAFSREGRLLWQKRLDAGISAAPAVDSGGRMLFAGTVAGAVFAIDASNGAVVWRSELPTKSDARILSDLLFVPGRGAVVASSWGGRFTALEQAGGKELHSWDAGIAPNAAAAADDAENVYCLRAVAKTGVQLVRVAPDGKESVLHQRPESEGPANRSLVSAAPAIDPGRGALYFALNAGRAGILAAWSLRGEKVLWTRHFQAALGTTPAVASDGSILLTDMSGFVHRVSPDGALSYRYASGGDYIVAGVVCDGSGTAFVPDSLGVLHAIRPDGTGNPVFELPRSAQARPSFDSRGNLYVPGTDRLVYVFSNNR